MRDAIKRYLPKALFVAAVLVFQISAQEKELTVEQYEAEMASLQLRGQTAREQIAQEQAKVEKLKQGLTETGEKIASVTRQIFATLGISEQDLVTAENELVSIHENLQHLSTLSPPEVSKDKIAEIESALELWKSSGVSSLKQISQRIGVIEEMLKRLKGTVLSYVPPSDADTVKAAEVVETLENKVITGSADTDSPHNFDTYTVRGAGEPESLFRIARIVYGDPLEWPRIYRANKALIDANFKKCEGKVKISEPQDLLLPGQVLQIPR